MLDALNEVSAQPGEPTGRLRLSVPLAAVPFVIAPVLPTFRTRYPRVEVDVTVEERFVDIVAEGFDAGVRLSEAIERVYAWELERGGKSWRVPVHGGVVTSDRWLSVTLAEQGLGLAYTFEPAIVDRLRGGSSGSSSKPTRPRSRASSPMCASTAVPSRCAATRLS